jgi:hypothetical protein
MSKKIDPVLFSVPVIEKLDLPTRAELFPQIESGEIDHIDFTARTYGTGRNHNPYLFKDSDLPAFAKSFEKKPFLRNHDTYDIDARDGLIVSSMNVGGAFEQTIRLTTRRGMIDFLEGRIDRFSIGWTYDDAICTICNSSFFSTSCNHWPGRTYQTADGPKVCQLLFVNPKGRETSAVNDPAVEGTEIIEASLDAHYLELNNQTLDDLKKELGITAEESTGDDEPAETAEDAEEVSNSQEEPEGQAPETIQENVDEPASEAAIEDPESMLEAQARRRSWELDRAEKDFFPEGKLDIMNVREKMAERAQLIKRARELADLADKEGRAFTDEERAEYDTIMGAGETPGKVDTLKNEIEGELEARNKLNEAEKSLAELAAEPEKPDGGKPANQLSRAEFNKLSAKEKSAFSKAGGKLIGE